ncbi:hypothetical protein LVD17_23950 [Fulvivirga ulvae]|uniref:hypothetical protein n=1 Tax=Fulvivirga ulvae TaxID=2904245 RepID=UPI001F1B6AB1|nr:hypothetical protein [Fulvivirga ulvae]UII31350.1 hypothetical protein LVD17_23950 [Fulvivirga ulvae]
MKKVCLLISLLIVYSLPSWSQTDTLDVVSSFIHVGVPGPGKYKIVAFKLSTAENAPISWQSGPIEPILEDSASRFMIKVDVPRAISESADMLECTAIAKKSYGIWSWLGYKKEIEIPYGGVNLSVIKLEIKSDPTGAEVYMVPIRVWDKLFKNRKLERSVDDLEFYKVNTSVTDTFVRIDQTVFKVVFHRNGLFKTLIHRPQPQSIEPIQIINVRF